MQLSTCDVALERVAPHAGAWIEMGRTVKRRRGVEVAPHAGAWIEIHTFHPPCCSSNVAPHAGAWIEMITIISLSPF